MTKPKRPKDTNQLAKFVVEPGTGQRIEPDPLAGKTAAGQKSRLPRYCMLAKTCGHKRYCGVILIAFHACRPFSVLHNRRPQLENETVTPPEFSARCYNAAVENRAVNASGTVRRARIASRSAVQGIRLSISICTHPIISPAPTPNAADPRILSLPCSIILTPARSSLISFVFGTRPAVRRIATNTTHCRALKVKPALPQCSIYFSYYLLFSERTSLLPK